ncbi:hypothetical protein EDD37DRAFT_510994 [Exophiala viscosa]|uniref:BZIP domain-containing protein n=1 Tax=Exophiala viscosa TaxID=2486360 RepID=A0AAN6DZQ4_9EURO|nr:hypothetical protein EDD36DRAFT_179465 [Exophiala viscosa]KAI1622219.1 hypothetical protein EDD37DRAFT_510994 [Exophiala viscosa]
MVEGRKRGRPRVDPKSDNWYGVSDAKERKRIQDRLAQRARRNRLGSQVTTNIQAPESHSTVSEATSQPASQATGTSLEVASQQAQTQGQVTSLALLPSDAAAQDSTRSPPSWMWTYLRRYQQTTVDHRFLCWPAWPLYAALVTHGTMQGTSCPDAGDQVKSPMEYLALPDPLRPSPLQLAVAHPRWIDRFPFQRFRDNMILLLGLIDLDEFIGDMFGMASLILRIETQRATWDPAAWAIGTEFSSKWGYLFL